MTYASNMWIKKVAIDLGTTNVLVYVPKRGIVVNEPSVVAMSRDDRRVLAVGIEAKDMIGRTPDTIIAERPLKDGVIANYYTTEAMLRYFINKALGGMRLFRPEVMVAVPAGSGAKLKTDVVRRDPLVAPFTRGQMLGSLRVSAGEGQTAFVEVPLVVLEAVEEAGILGRAWDAIRLWIK